MFRGNLTLTSHSRLDAHVSVREGNLSVPLFFVLSLLLTLGAIAADQFAAPALYSTSPLWATGICLLLAWRRSAPFNSDREASNARFSSIRIGLFVAAHLLLIGLAYALPGLKASAGSNSLAGWLTAALKLSVFLPTLLLVSRVEWKSLARRFSAEIIAAAVVLFTFFPVRVLESSWPWYGQWLGRATLFLSSLFVPGLTYIKALAPTIQGPDLDVTILQACSGISGIELFDCLFAAIVFLDWNRLRKGRVLTAYFAGLFAMLLGNLLRLTALVVLGNRGLSDAVAAHHLSAGWVFFSVIFLAYLASVYRWILAKN